MLYIPVKTQNHQNSDLDARPSSTNDLLMQVHMAALKDIASRGRPIPTPTEVVENGDITSPIMTVCGCPLWPLCMTLLINHITSN